MFTLINIAGKYISPITFALALILVIFLSVLTVLYINRIIQQKKHHKKNSILAKYIIGFVNKHQNDPNTEIIDVGQLVASHAFRRRVACTAGVSVWVLAITSSLFVFSPSTTAYLGVQAEPSHWVVADKTKIADSGVKINLDDYLIPVRNIDGENANDENWANYGAKKWANAVSIKPEALAKYTTNGKTNIDLDDIAGWFVYLPHFQYHDDAESDDLIDINLVTKENDSKNNYWTTPEELVGVSGIWIGKFETTGDFDTMTILPNASPLKISLSTQSDTEPLSFKLENHYTNKATSTEFTDAAIFSYSIYGSGKEKIQANNNQSEITGCGSEVGNNYGYYGGVNCNDLNGKSLSWSTKQGVLASTTHNIYGIYDMAGGVAEFVAANTPTIRGGSAGSGNAANINAIDEVKKDKNTGDTDLYGFRIVLVRYFGEQE